MGSAQTGALNALAASNVSEVALTEIDIVGAAPADYVAVGPTNSSPSPIQKSHFFLLSLQFSF